MEAIPLFLTTELAHSFSGVQILKKRKVIDRLIVPAFAAPTLFLRRGRGMLSTVLTALTDEATDMEGNQVDSIATFTLLERHESIP